MKRALALSSVLAISMGAAVLAIEWVVPPSWGAEALLKPARRPVGPMPQGAEPASFRNDGLTLRGWWFRSSGDKRGNLIFLHGISDNREAGIGIARSFSAKGLDVLVYDNRAHGESDGEHCSYGVHERRDLLAILDTMPAGPTLLMGNSLGASVALQAAAQRPDLAGVVATSSFADLRSVIADRTPWFLSRNFVARALGVAEQRASFKASQASALLAAPEIRAPVLLVHGQADDETPVDHSWKIHRALRTSKRLIIVPGMGHDDRLPQDAWRHVVRWIEARFTPEGP